MTLLRAAGRTMLASFFVVTGAKSLAKPDDLVPRAQPVAERLVPLAQRVAPASMSSYIPDDTKTLVRATGAAQVIGGLALATGLGRRPGSALLAASMVPHVMASVPKRSMTADERSHARSLLLRNIALLGATLSAAQDTQGHPSLGYRAHQTQRKLASQLDDQRATLADQVNQQRHTLAEQASDVVEAVGATTRREKKVLRRQAKKVSKQSRALVKKGRARSADLSDQLHANAKALSKQVKAAKKGSAARAKAARKANVEAYGSWLDQLKAGYSQASKRFASSIS